MENNILTEEVLQEMYFGKRAGLIRIEEFLERIKKQYFGDRHTRLTMSLTKTINKDPLIRKIANELSELFGFKDVAVSFANRLNFNAYTCCFVSDDEVVYDGNNEKVDWKKFVGSVTVTNSGFSFNKRKAPINFLLCMNLGCLLNPNITIPELLAIILHEVGHNFARVVMGVTGDYRAEEKFSDQFASMYGYGPELASAFAKVMIDRSEFDRKYKDVPVLNILVGLNQIRKGMTYISDEEEHPVTKNRIDGVLRQMEADLKDTPNLSPEMKRDLQKQIDAVKATINDTFVSNDKDSTGTRMTKYYFGTLEPNIRAERIGEERADRHSSPTNLNKKMDNMYHKKGWFK